MVDVTILIFVINMEALYHKTNKLLQDVGRDLGRFERSDFDSARMIETNIQAHVGLINSNCERLAALANKETLSRRSSAKLRVDQLKYDVKHTEAALRSLQQRKYLFFIYI